MAALAANATYEEKEKWLLRPVQWAGDAASMCGISAGAMWYAGVEMPLIAGVAILGNVAAAGLLIWAVKRLMKAARGQ